MSSFFLKLLHNTVSVASSVNQVNYDVIAEL